MKYIRRYNESRTIKAINETIKDIFNNEIEKLGYSADLNHIDVSEVTDMRRMFIYSSFNGDISRWNVGNVRNMIEMFFISKFNGDISNWNVGNVLFMNWMFYGSSFKRDLSLWNVRNVFIMDYIFTNSPLKGREPWWYILKRVFIDIKSMYESIEVYEWIDVEKGIIWKKRLNYALQDFGKEGYEIPQSIWGFTYR